MAEPQPKKPNWVLKGKEERFEDNHLISVLPITFIYAVHSVSWTLI